MRREGREVAGEGGYTGAGILSTLMRSGPGSGDWEQEKGQSGRQNVTLSSAPHALRQGAWIRRAGERVDIAKAGGGMRSWGGLCLHNAARFPEPELVHLPAHSLKLGLCRHEHPALWGRGGITGD